jgi:hypothetical protein
MIASHVHDALAQVRLLQEVILERRQFRGFSGQARVAGGCAALLAAGLLASERLPDSPVTPLAVWFGVLAFALIANYAALAWWFFNDPHRRRDLLALKPAIDVMPGLAVGAMLSLAVMRAGQHELLYGIWMGCFGLAHTSCRLSLPPANFLVGLFYMLAGGACLFVPGWAFPNPWSMGLIFFIGELIGGWVLFRERDAAPAPYSTARPSQPEDL